MCGFAGIVAWNQQYRVNRAVLEKMSARIAHRGPDGQGIWESPGSDNAPYVGLAHRRLAIIDLDQRANQPFTDGRGRWIVFNGEIYNYRELRKELESLLPDYAWRTQSDTEVLLAAYAAWGSDCAERLNGMFAFAIWDGAKQELFLARDRMGQKPLYYACVRSDGSAMRDVTEDDQFSRPAAIAFASEIGAARSVPWLASQVDPDALLEYLQWGYTTGSQSIYSSVSQLGPSEYLGVGPIAGISKLYYSSNTSEPNDDTTAISRTRASVEQAVRRQLVADVPVGCFLSGGVDSSVIAAAMKQVSPGQKILTFSIGFDDARYDETVYAASVAQHLKTDHRQFIVRANAANDLPQLAAVFGEPFADSSALPTHYLARETRHHVKVTLSGDGGDELFGGYDRYRAIRLGSSIDGTLVGKLLSVLAMALPGTHPKSRLMRLKRFLRSLSRSSGERYSSYLRIFSDSQLKAVLSDSKHSLPEPGCDVVAAFFDVLSSVNDPVQSARGVDETIYLPCDILTKLDRASMLHALEVRSPFMDHELVEFAATLTTKQLLKGGPKRMLREAFADLLPAWVFKRKKMGFAVPIGEWFRGQLRPMLRDHLFAADAFGRSHFNMKVVERLVDEHQREKVDHSQRLYALLMLELWWKTQN